MLKLVYEVTSLLVCIVKPVAIMGDGTPLMYFSPLESVSSDCPICQGSRTKKAPFPGNSRLKEAT